MFPSAFCEIKRTSIFERESLVVLAAIAVVIVVALAVVAVVLGK